MSVYDNMAFSLLYRKTPKGEIRQRVEEVAEVLELTPLLDRRPKALSGGQRQRVAMGRAIVRKPQVFLFDEPLSNLDAKLRGSMRMEIKRLHRRFGVTTVYVTHDQIEAMTLADRVVVMNGGHIEQFGTPDEVYQNPKTQFVAGFIGSPTMNFLPAHLNNNGDLNVAEGAFTLKGRSEKGAEIKDYIVGFRPENIGLDSDDLAVASKKDAYASAECVVEEVEALGADTLLFVRMGNQRITARILPDAKIKPGQKVRVRFDLAKMHLFNEASGEIVK
jgi:multiple sugar transport system ATP-binding protein